jgi:hypothetical protein
MILFFMNVDIEDIWFYRKMTFGYRSTCYFMIGNQELLGRICIGLDSL